MPTVLRRWNDPPDETPFGLVALEVVRFHDADGELVDQADAVTSTVSLYAADGELVGELVGEASS